MARFEATVTSPESPDEVFDYLADFRSVAEWDPSVKSARLVAGQPGHPGAEFEVVVSFLGREVPLTYRSAVVEPPRRLLLIAETSTITSRDEITLSGYGEDSTAVTYSADLRLRGILGALDPALQLAFTRLGGRAREGLAARLVGPLSARRNQETATR